MRFEVREAIFDRGPRAEVLPRRRAEHHREGFLHRIGEFEGVVLDPANHRSTCRSHECFRFGPRRQHLRKIFAVRRMNKPISSARTLGSRLARAFSGIPAARAMRPNNAASVAPTCGSDAAIRAGGEGAERNGDEWRGAASLVTATGGAAGSGGQLSGRCIAGSDRGAFGAPKKGRNQQDQAIPSGRHERGGRRDRRATQPDRTSPIRRAPARLRQALWFGPLLAPLDRHRDDIGADVQPVAVAQKIGSV